MKCEIRDNKDMKTLRSDIINFNFNKLTGYTMIWGKTPEEDPIYCPFGPMIADIEVTTICYGIKGKLCQFCYKANTPNGQNMSLDTFKMIFNKIPKTLTQIAFGADSTLTANPDLFPMMDYCRNNDYNQVVPNITAADVSDDIADKLKQYCGAVAISYYPDRDKNVCYDSVKKLTDRGMTQINIHAMISEQTLGYMYELFNDVKNDPRLEKLNAIVLLSLKKRGRGVGYDQLTFDKFKALIDYAIDNKIPIGFDSCSCPKFLKAVKMRPNYDIYEMYSEACESTLHSFYCGVDGIYYPCSFCPGQGEWNEGIDMRNVLDFNSDLWHSPKVVQWRNKLLTNIDENKCRNCPMFEV